MNETNTTFLKNKFPLLYKDLYYFEINNGWFDLICELSSKLEPLFAKSQSDDEDYVPRVTQVKQKFGELRFYVSNPTEEMLDIITDFERKSRITCEICGDKSKIVNDNGWFQSLCEKSH